MKINENGHIREMTPAEIAEVETQAAEQERQYWFNTPYRVAVNNEIRKKYDLSAELGILRQRDEKPEEYAEYFAYCEECKAFVKNKKQL
jgi:hypothetical protein